MSGTRAAGPSLRGHPMPIDATVWHLWRTRVSSAPIPAAADGEERVTAKNVAVNGMYNALKAAAWSVDALGS